MEAAQACLLWSLEVAAVLPGQLSPFKQLPFFLLMRTFLVCYKGNPVQKIPRFGGFCIKASLNVGHKTSLFDVFLCGSPGHSLLDSSRAQGISFVASCRGSWSNLAGPDSKANAVVLNPLSLLFSRLSLAFLQPETTRPSPSRMLRGR